MMKNETRPTWSLWGPLSLEIDQLDRCEGPSILIVNTPENLEWIKRVSFLFSLFYSVFTQIDCFFPHHGLVHKVCNHDVCNLESCIIIIIIIVDRPLDPLFFVVFPFKPRSLFSIYLTLRCSKEPMLIPITKHHHHHHHHHHHQYNYHHHHHHHHQNPTHHLVLTHVKCHDLYSLVFFLSPLWWGVTMSMYGVSRILL